MIYKQIRTWRIWSGNQEPRPWIRWSCRKLDLEPQNPVRSYFLHGFWEYPSFQWFWNPPMLTQPYGRTDTPHPQRICAERLAQGSLLHLHRCAKSRQGMPWHGWQPWVWAFGRQWLHSWCNFTTSSRGNGDTGIFGRWWSVPWLIWPDESRPSFRFC